MSLATQDTLEEKKPQVRFNKRYLTVYYSNVGKNALGKVLSHKRKCDGFMVAAQEKGCIAKLYRKKKYNFVSTTPAYLKINTCRGLITEDIDNEQFAILDEAYIVDGDHFVKQEKLQPVVIPEPEPIQQQEPIATPSETKFDWHSKPDVLLRAMLTKRKLEFGLDDEGIKSLDRESMILLLS
jgi:hypothetical protein